MDNLAEYYSRQSEPLGKSYRMMGKKVILNTGQRPSLHREQSLIGDEAEGRQSKDREGTVFSRLGDHMPLSKIVSTQLIFTELNIKPVPAPPLILHTYPSTNLKYVRY